ncbi:MAG: pyrroline-5-carboxylate reductase [Benjaminiella poitrasii]|nr:MAG: pyrroline-5-carboxylate reductase [Benjaminiella poitrasii]
MSDIPVIALIGGGNMSEAVMGGLYSSGHAPSHLRFSEPIESRRAELASRYPGVTASASNTEVVQGADVVILAVKPQVMAGVVQGLASDITPSTLVISIAAGIQTDAIQRWLNSPTTAIVRLMPNTPALIGEGALGLFATAHVSDDQKQRVEQLFRSVSKVLSWVEDESMIDAVTGVSGSGPAYFFLIMESMENAAVELGFSREDAKALTVQTCLGAARMAQENKDETLAGLRRKVTSPNGTTEAAIKKMESLGIRGMMKKAIVAATDRSQELAKELGKL